MIGRGTRLCENLFGEGKDKEEFLIFDFYRNFEYFEMNPEGAKPAKSQSIVSLLLICAQILNSPCRMEHIKVKKNQGLFMTTLPTSCTSK